MKPPPTPTPGPAGWMARPVLSALIALVWLLLVQSLALPQLIVAVALGMLLPRILHGFLGPAVRPRRVGLALRFICIVLYDVVVSNLVVARIVLSPWSTPQPAWVRVPLRLRNPNAIVLLATIITTTPGTVSCVVDDQRHEILVHALDCRDSVALVLQIQERYENPLMEILG